MKTLNAHSRGSQMKSLSGLDAAFVYAETETTPMNVIVTIVVDRGDARTDGRPGQPALDYESIVARLEQRLPLLPQFTRKLFEVPFGLGHPVWVETEDFDLGQHVMRILAREPGGREELAEVVAQAAGTRLDRSRPLWSLWVVEGLDGGKLALIIRSHHALLDGMSGAALLLHLFDRCEGAIDPLQSPSATNQMDAGQPPTRGPVPLTLVGHALSELPERAECLWNSARDIGGALGRIARSRNDWGTTPPATLFSSTHAGFNRSLSSGRSVAYSRVPMSAIRAIRASLGGSLNDVILAGCTIALRRQSLEAGITPMSPLVAAIPVSTRTPDHEPGGNRISVMAVRLPIQLEDPVAQLRAIASESRLAKRFHRTLGRKTVAALAEFSAPSFTPRALALYSRHEVVNHHRPVANLMISNVVGPDRALRLVGARVEAIHPHGPLMEGVGLNITVMSYAESVDIGVLTCPRALPDPRNVADALAGGIEALAKRATRPSPEIPRLMEALTRQIGEASQE